VRPLAGGGLQAGGGITHSRRSSPATLYCFNFGKEYPTPRIDIAGLVLPPSLVRVVIDHPSDR
jgi:hypothetical protein